MRWFFLLSVNADIPAHMAVDPASGRIAIAGGTGGAGLTGGRDDTFISLREADGSPVAGFGTDGVVKGDFPGVALRDRAVDVVLRPDGSVVALVEAESAPNVLHSTLYGLSPHRCPSIQRSAAPASSSSRWVTPTRRPAGC